MVHILDRRSRPGPTLALWACVCLTAAGHVAHGHLHDAHNAKHIRAVTSEASFVGFSLFTNGTLSGLGLSSACEDALYQTVNCDDAAADLVITDYVGSFDNSTLTALVCDTGCERSIAQMETNVATNCGANAELIDGLPFLGIVNKFWSNWNQSCFTDPTTGENCNDVMAAFPNVTDVTLLPTEDLCGYCYLEKFALMQASAYSNAYEENWQSRYEIVAAACNITVSDFNATESVFNVTVPTTTVNCVSGNTYTTKAGDTCDSIALANSVSAATMYYINSNIHNCTDVAEGTSLCLPLACESTYTVRDDDTCTGIAVDAALLTSDVVAFNSLLDWNCTNLHATNPYWGTTLCISTPGGTYNGSALSTGSSSSATSADIVDPPSGATVANGTTTYCAQWYLADGDLTCVQICLNYGIAINSFTEANPSLNKTKCDADLVLGDAYCLDPIEGWDWATSSTNATSTYSTTIVTATGTASSTSTASSTTGAASDTSASSAGVATGTSTVSSSSSATTSGAVPSPTEPGAIDSCTTWYYTVSGDTCYSIAQTSDITLDDFYSWNTGVGDACEGLWLNYYVCVGV